MKKLFPIISLMLIISVGFFFSPASVYAATELDSYSETNQSEDQDIDGTFVNWCQAFTTPNDGVSYTLDSSKFYLKDPLGRTGNVTSKLYAVGAGTYGVDIVGTGAALATASNVAATAIGTAYEVVTFTFDNTYSMSPNTQYVICGSNVDLSGGIKIGSDNSSPSHGGNPQYYAGGWTGAGSTRDTIFYVYGTAPASTATVKIPDIIILN